MSIPFAYSVSRTTYHSGHDHNFPTLDKAVAYLIKHECPAYLAADDQQYVRAYYEDGTEDYPVLGKYMEEVQVDLSAVHAYINDLWIKSENAYAAWKAANPKGHRFSGQSFLCELNKADVIRREVDKRRWQWKVAG